MLLTVGLGWHNCGPLATWMFRTRLLGGRDAFIGRRGVCGVGGLTGVHSGPVSCQDLCTVGTRVFELLLLQRTVQVTADSTQVLRDGHLAEVCTHGL